MKKCTCIKPLVAPIAWHKAYSKAVRLVEEVVGARVALKDRIPRSRSMPRSPTENFAEARRAYEEALGNLNKARIALLTDTARRPARGAGLIHKHGHRRRGSSSSRSSRSSSNSLSLSLGGDAETNAVPTCAFPPSTNLSIFTGPDVRLPTPWCTPEAVPPPARSLVELAAAGQTSPIPVLPSLLVPCCAHSGTTFLWRCMQYAFHPQRVCGARTSVPHNPAYAGRVGQWTNAACHGRRFLLPGLTGNIEGHWDYRKEWFFYGGGGGSWAKGWAEYVGVDLPICYWEPEFQRLLRSQPLDDTLAHSRRLCQPPAVHRSTRGGHSEGHAGVADRTPNGDVNSTGTGSSHSAAGAPSASRCTHRACMILDLDKTRLNPTYAPEYDRRTKPRYQFQASKSLPRLRPDVHTGAVVSDMTPNYLCSPKALRNLAGSIGAPAHFRMLVLHRMPFDMVKASYKVIRTRSMQRHSLLQPHLASNRQSLHSLFLLRLPAFLFLTYFRGCSPRC